MRVRRTLVALGCLALTACGEAAPEYDFATGPLMLPGEDCTRCHRPNSSYEKAPTWTVAGTVYPRADSAAHEGVSNVEVLLSDASGALLETLLTNAAGNFYASLPLPSGFRVELAYQGERIAMPCPPPSGGCAKCHDDPPIGFAPGRIFVPQGREGEPLPFDCETWTPAP